MVNDCPAVTQLLREDADSSLKLKYESAAHSRSAWIEIPDPDEGKVYDDLGGDQGKLYCNPRKNDYMKTLSSGNAREALHLLEARCAGEEVRGTVRCQMGRFPNDSPEVYAPVEAQGGLDDWLFGNVYFETAAEGEGLVTSAYVQPFPFNPSLIAQTRGRTVGETLRPFAHGTRGIELIDHFARGAAIQGGMISRNGTGNHVRNTQFQIPKHGTLADRGIIVPGHKGLQGQFHRLGLTTDAKNFLFLSQMADQLFDTVPHH